MQLYGDTLKPVEIDETDEVERITSLKHRETLIRGMGKKHIQSFLIFIQSPIRCD